MECKDFEKDIYLYPELSRNQKEAVDRHINNCLPCNALYVKVQQTQSIINQLAEDRISPHHAAKLTGDIMSSINRPALSPRQINISGFFLQRGLKIGLSIMSSMLLFLLLLESFSDIKPVKNEDQSDVRASIILDSRIFREGSSKLKNTFALRGDCLSPFKSNQYFLECAKSRLK